MNKIMTIISCLFLLASCENEIPFNIQDNPPKLIVNALLDDDKELNDIVVALTGRDEITSVNEAIVRIYLNGTLKDEISTPAGPDSTNLRGTYQTGLKFSAGDRIKIEVQTKNNKHHAWAEVTVPTPIPVEKIDTATIKKQTPGVQVHISVRGQHLLIMTRKKKLLQNRYGIPGRNRCGKH